MDTYHRPLATYCRATGLGRADNIEPDDVVNGFFAARLADQEYLRSWSSSGLRLRQWLRNGINFYVRELIRAKARKDRLEPSGFTDGEPAGSQGTGGSQNQQEPSAADSAFERDWARGALNTAIESTKSELAKAGKAEIWEVFWKVRVGGVAYEALAVARGETTAQVRQVVFAVAERLRDAIREVLVKDGAKPDEVQNEIRDMLHALHTHD